MYMYVHVYHTIGIDQILAPKPFEYIESQVHQHYFRDEMSSQKCKNKHKNSFDAYRWIALGAHHGLHRAVTQRHTAHRRALTVSYQQVLHDVIV